MKNPKDPRHIARVVALMGLYTFFFDNKSEKFSFEELELGRYSETLEQSILEGVKANFTQIDALINQYSDPIKTDELDILILQIVRVAIFEGFISKSTPPKVAVDEAIELTRDFGLEMAVKKVSGILGKIFDNTVKPEEKSVPEIIENPVQLVDDK